MCSFLIVMVKVIVIAIPMTMVTVIVIVIAVVYFPHVRSGYALIYIKNRTSNIKNQYVHARIHVFNLHTRGNEGLGAKFSGSYLMGIAERCTSRGRCEL